MKTKYRTPYFGDILECNLKGMVTIDHPNYKNKLYACGFKITGNFCYVTGNRGKLVGHCVGLEEVEKDGDTFDCISVKFPGRLTARRLKKWMGDRKGHPIQFIPKSERKSKRLLSREEEVFETSW